MWPPDYLVSDDYTKITRKSRKHYRIYRRLTRISVWMKRNPLHSTESGCCKTKVERRPFVHANFFWRIHSGKVVVRISLKAPVQSLEKGIAKLGFARSRSLAFCMFRIFFSVANDNFSVGRVAAWPNAFSERKLNTAKQFQRIFVFPLIRKRLNLRLLFKTAKAPSTKIERFIWSRAPRPVTRCRWACTLHCINSSQILVSLQKSGFLGFCTLFLQRVVCASLTAVISVSSNYFFPFSWARFSASEVFFLRHIVCGPELTIFHVFLFHPHEGGIPVCFGKAFLSTSHLE